MRTIFTKIVWIVAACVQGVAYLQFMGTLNNAQSPPEQAAGAAMAACCAIIPYCFARAFSEALASSKAEKSTKDGPGREDQCLVTGIFRSQILTDLD